MKILDKYVLREFLLTFTYCAVAFFSLEILIDLFDRFARILEANAPLSMILRYYGALLLLHIEFLMPAALFLTTLYTLWRFARNGELTAMRASGVSIYRIMSPLLLVGVLSALFTIGVKELVAPDALSWADAFRQSRFRNTRGQVKENVAFLNTAAQRQWLIGSLDIGHPEVLNNVEITEERAESQTPARKLAAERVEWLDGEWWFFKTKELNYTETGNPIGVMKLLPASDQGMLIPDVTERPEDFVNEVKNWDFLSAADIHRYLAAHPDLPPATVAQHRVDMHLRLSFPWACLIVTLFGIPGGARGGRQSMLSGMLMTIACFFAFFSLAHFGVFLGKRELLSPWLGAWLANIVFFAAGIHMLIKIR